MAAIYSNTYGSGALESTTQGAMIALAIQGNNIGRVESISAEIQYGTLGIYQLGSMFPQEHIYTRYEGTAQLRHYMMNTSSLVDMHLAALGEDIMNTGTVDVVVKNIAYQNKVIAAFIGCTATNYQFETQTGQPVNETLNVTYLKATNMVS